VKKFVVDSSTLITISSNCIIQMLKLLSLKDDISFILPESVYYETVQRPVKIKRFELNAIRIRDAIEEGYLKLFKTTPQIKKNMKKLQKTFATICSTKTCKEIRLIDEGEAETLALISEINADALVIDERTTRMIIEAPEKLKEYLERRHKQEVHLDQNTLRQINKDFGTLPVFRSVDLIALAYDNGSFEKVIHKSKQALEAALYAAKYSGAAVSFEEIREYLKEVRN